MRDADRALRQTFARLAGVLGVVGAALSGAPSEAAEMSSAVADLYTSVSIYPPSANSMTVCYGFVCRRRQILEFTPQDRTALTQIMTPQPRCVPPETKVSDAVLIMLERGFRHLPIVGADHKVLGVFSIRDALPREIGMALNEAEFNEQVNDALG